MHVRRRPPGVRGCSLSAKARGREIERSPKELDGARLSEEPGAETLENQVGLQENRGEAAGVVAVIRPRLDVLSERHRVGHLVGPLRYLGGGDSDAAQRIEHLAIELGYRDRAKGDRGASTAARHDRQLMSVGEVEMDLKCADATRHRARREAERSHRKTG